MDKSNKAAIENAEDALVRIPVANRADQGALSKLFNSVYQQVPNGGFPHIMYDDTTFLDGSTMHSLTIDGVETILLLNKILRPIAPTYVIFMATSRIRK